MCEVCVWERVCLAGVCECVGRGGVERTVKISSAFLCGGVSEVLARLRCSALWQ